MSHDIVLFSLLKNTFALLLENEDIGDDCELLVEKLDKPIAQVRGISDDLFTCLGKLKSAVVSLRPCFAKLKKVHNPNNDLEFSEADKKHKTENPKESHSKSEVSKSEIGNSSASDSTERPVHDKAKQPNGLHIKLQNELSKIDKTSSEFTEAMVHILESAKISAQVFDSNESKRETKITATKICVIGEILGNLTNPTVAAENCNKHILKLHAILDLNKSPFPTWHRALSNLKLEKMFESSEIRGMDSVTHINLVVFHFMKEFIGNPVPLLDWPMIDVVSEKKKTYHPVLGKRPTNTNTPDPFTPLNLAEIDSQVSAVNCAGDIFAKESIQTESDKPSEGITKITPGGNRRYRVKRNHKILCVSIDCADCKTSAEPTSQIGEASSAQPSEASFRPSDTPCKGKMYTLTSHESYRHIQCFLYIVDMEGINKELKKELGFLERSATEVLEAKIFCIKGKRVIIFDVTKCDIHICDDEGKQLKAIANATGCMNPISITSYEGEVVFSECRSKLNVYNIDEEAKSLSLAREVTLNRAVQAVAFNHELNELIMLCHSSVLSQYHLKTYVKDREGEQSVFKLKQDIKLHNSCNYKRATLICHPNGPIVLLDNHKLLYLRK